MEETRVGIIGFGNMGCAIGSALSKVRGFSVAAFEKDKAKRKKVTFFNDLSRLIAESNVIVLALKPQDIPQFLLENREFFLKNRPLLVTIAAGLSCGFFEQKLPGMHIVRVMPNLPAKVNAGVAFIAKGKNATKADMAIVEKIFQAVGKVFVAPESALDKVTAVSGSGPGFVFHLMDCFYSGALKLGFSAPVAREMVAQTFLGSAQLAANEKIDFKELAAQVASKGGTTRAGLDVLEAAKLNKLIDKTFSAAAKRAKVLSNQLSKLAAAKPQRAKQRG